MNRILAALFAVVGLGGVTLAQAPAGMKVATFAGGCFWCTEADFDKVPGVVSTTSGYIGGKTDNPTYEQISAGGTGHAEAVQVVYDPAKVSYEKLLDVYWHSIDPFAKNRQFCDRGDQYRSAIFYHDAEQRQLAEKTKAELEAKLKQQPFETQIVMATKFYPAEDYHQDFHIKNATKYKFYRWNCGRDQRLEQIWGKKTS